MFFHAVRVLWFLSMKIFVIFIPSPPDIVVEGRHYVFGLSLWRSCYHDISWTVLSSLNEPYIEKPIAATDDVVRFWKSRSQQAVEVAKVSTSMLRRQIPSATFLLSEKTRR